MNILETFTGDYHRAKKTAQLRAKPIISLVDRSVLTKLLVDTLEGREPIEPSSMFCMGEVGEPWQQTPKALLRKYDVVDIDNDGWLVCKPKPENEIEVYIASEDGYIRGQWGETIDGEKNLQRVRAGDAIARQPHDHSDQWVIRGSLFKVTYSILGE